MACAPVTRIRDLVLARQQKAAGSTGSPLRVIFPKLGVPCLGPLVVPIIRTIVLGSIFGCQVPCKPQFCISPMT